MAYFVVSETTGQVWKILTPIKIDVRTESGRFELEELKGSNQFVKGVTFSNVGSKCLALVEGKFFMVNKLATLKNLLLKYAVENKMNAAKLKQLLRPRKSLKRKEFLESVGVLTQ